jgi:hypothetical protein
MAYKFNINQGEEWLLKAAGLGAALLGIVSVYTFYKNNIWHPKIEVKSVDFKKGVADLIINGKPLVLKGDSSYLIAQDWGIKFGYTYKGNGGRVYDRIEVLKKNMVHSVIRKAEGEEMASFTANEETFYDDTFNGMSGLKEGEWVAQISSAPWGKNM